MVGIISGEFSVQVVAVLNSLSNENGKLIALGSAVTVSGLILGALWYKKYLQNTPPAKWMKIGEVEELCIYPVKSFKGIKTSSFECTPFGARLGFMRDRSFVVINAEGKFVTGREYPKMTQLVPKISGTLITFSSPETSDEVEIDTEKINGKQEKVKIWDSWAEGIDCGDEVATWLSKCILGQETGLRLLFCGVEEKGKNVNGRITSYSKMVDVQLQSFDGGFFSDGVSYHLISQASVRDLNSRLDGTQVSALNFRPNLVVKGDMLLPFEEDSWKWVKIGDVVFQCLAPCTRCLFTTIDPNTGEKSKKMEPLASLKRYRHVREPEKRKVLTTPAMGIYLGLRSPGSVSVGDEIFIPQM